MFKEENLGEKFFRVVVRDGWNIVEKPKWKISIFRGLASCDHDQIYREIGMKYSHIYI